MRHKPMICDGCKGGFDSRHPKHFVCSFAKNGFLLSNGRKARRCGVHYHAQCIRVGAPFESRTEEGLQFPHYLPLPHFVCESCTVRSHLGRELERTGKDVVLLMLERMRMIDTVSHWAKKTMQKYGGRLRYLGRFGAHYGVATLVAPRLVRPAVSPSTTLAWAELLYSLRQTRGKDGEYRRLKYASVRSLRSAAGWYYTMDMAARYPRQVMRDRHRRGMVMEYVSPTDELAMTLGASAMAQRLGTEATKSWALSHIHVAYMDDYLDSLFEASTDARVRHELACAGAVNLSAYLGWLRGGEVFGIGPDAVTVLLPSDGPTRGLPPGLGAVEIELQGQTKTDRTVTADIIIAFTTLSGLCLGKWMVRLKSFVPVREDHLFSTKIQPIWTSAYFRQAYAFPLLERQRHSGEASLKAFSDKAGHRVRDKITSMHSWKRGGRSKVSRAPRHNEPFHPKMRRATDPEIYEHGRWSKSDGGESMPRRYNQWALDERIGVTLLCM
jgi:hypothetical protein